MTLFIADHRRAYAIALASGLAFFLPAAHAARCANGGNPPCPARDPGPSHPNAPYSASYHGPKSAGSTQSVHAPSTFTAAKKPTVGPVSPGPTHSGASSASTANKQGIIFVGGHAQPAGSKVALNPQPIPPGHPVSGSMLASHPQTVAPKPAPADPHSH
jgi:hypothetical protein